MKETALIFGATGTLGKRVTEALDSRYSIIKVGHSSGDFQVDLADKETLNDLFESIGEVDHIVSAAGIAKFGQLDSLTDDDFELSLSNKLMGQVNVVRIGANRISSGGSLTVTTGVLARSPIEGSSAISMVNAGLEGFVRAAALELDSVRVNAVSPGWVSETLESMGRDPSMGVPASRVAKQGYVTSIEGSMTGRILEVTPDS